MDSKYYPAFMRYGIKVSPGILLITILLCCADNAYSEGPITQTYKVEVSSDADDNKSFPAKMTDVKWASGNMEVSQKVTLQNLFLNYKFDPNGFVFTEESYKTAAENVKIQGRFNPDDRTVTFNAPIKFEKGFWTGNTGHATYWYYIMPVRIANGVKDFVWDVSEIKFKVNDDGIWTLHTPDGTEEGTAIGIGAGEYGEYYWNDAPAGENPEITRHDSQCVITGMTFTPYYASVDNLETTDKEEASKTYDLMGREVQQPAKGIYIRNGRKVIIR